MKEALISWLKSHSTSVVREGSELRFSHSTGSTSIITARDLWVDGTVPVRNDQLASFYDEYWAASIGDGYIVIGTPVLGGIEVSHGYRIPDLLEMASTSSSLGISPSEDFEIFMMQASWMFIYGIRGNDGSLIEYDRDFKEFDTLVGIEAVLNQWWEIEKGDAPELT